jgi:prepilin-type N-terminal cleavage/methylation domain-containing protein
MKVQGTSFVEAAVRFSPPVTAPVADPGVEGRSSSLSGDDALPHDHGERGLTITELAVALMIISILSVIGIGLLNGRIEKAWLARCHCELRSIQSTVWMLSDGVTWPERSTFWERAWDGKKPGPYYYLANYSDANKGHGNDIDFCDEENPGNSGSNRDCKDIRFVVFCQHNHRHLANYVFIEDEGPPVGAGWNRDTNPGWDRYVNPKKGGGPN